MKQPTYELKASDLDYLSFDPSKAAADNKGTFTYVADLSNVDVEQLWTVGLNMDPTLFNFVNSVKVTVQHEVESAFTVLTSMPQPIAPMPRLHLRQTLCILIHKMEWC